MMRAIDAIGADQRVSAAAGPSTEHTETTISVPSVVAVANLKSYGVQASAITLPASTRSFGELSLSSSVPVSSSFLPRCGFSAPSFAIN